MSDERQSDNEQEEREPARHECPGAQCDRRYRQQQDCLYPPQRRCSRGRRRSRTAPGNKRCALLALERFLAANGRPILDTDPDTDVPMMDRIAAGDASQDEVAIWIEQRSTPSA